jgi:SHS2 domain-containing protein
LFDFLQELVFYKDADLLLFGKYLVKIDRQDSQFRLQAEAHGETLDHDRHDLVVDVKAVTLHQFEVKETDQGWEARVILDI